MFGKGKEKPMDKVIKGYDTLSIFEKASYTNDKKNKYVIPDNAIMGITYYNYKKEKKKSIWRKIIAFFTNV